MTLRLEKGLNQCATLVSMKRSPLSKYIGAIHDIRLDKLTVVYDWPEQLLVYKSYKKAGYKRLTADANGSLMQRVEKKHAATIANWVTDWVRRGGTIPVEIKVERVPVAAGDHMAKKFKEFVTSEMLRRFGSHEQNTRLAVATLLDPRFIKSYFQSPVARSKAENAIVAEIEKEVMLDNLDADAALLGDPSVNAEEAPGGGGSSTSGDLWSSHAELAQNSRAETVGPADVGGRARGELRAYLLREIAPINKNPLEIWETLKPGYPNLYRVARHLWMAKGFADQVTRKYGGREELEEQHLSVGDIGVLEKNATRHRTILALRRS
ncbi:hypothetical protein FOCC_FOCC012646 [Frankliniella occidentalis]|nr:hypothetical protein FOCC_FOCC012646 [Frankliniella occidentalis]